MVTEGVDTSVPTGRLLFHLLAGIAEFERKLIRERVRAGQRAAKTRGKHLGRPTADTVTSETAAIIVKLREQGYSLRKIAAAIRVPVTSVPRYLHQATAEQPVPVVY